MFFEVLVIDYSKLCTKWTGLVTVDSCFHQTDALSLLQVCRDERRPLRLNCICKSTGKTVFFICTTNVIQILRARIVLEVSCMYCCGLGKEDLVLQLVCICFLLIILPPSWVCFLMRTLRKWSFLDSYICISSLF